MNSISSSRSLSVLLTTLALFCLPLAASAEDKPEGGADGLLLTEIVVTPTDGEFVEIHNPTGSTIDLTDVYLTDATFAGGGTYYYNIVTGGNAGGRRLRRFSRPLPSRCFDRAG